jgi:hypothetical protein
MPLTSNSSKVDIALRARAADRGVAKLTGILQMAPELA